MSTSNEEEKIAYERYMKSQGYIKIDGKWKCVKYPEKDPKSYKESVPSKN